MNNLSLNLSIIHEVNSERNSHSTIKNPNDNDPFEIINSSAELKESFNTHPQQPNSIGFVAWVERIIDYLSGVFGEAMNAPRLNDALGGIFSNESGWESGPKFYCGDKQHASYMSKTHEGKTYVVSAVSHDRPENESIENALAGGRSIATTLNDIQKKYSEGEVKVLIPIAQYNDYGPAGIFGKREHLVLLEADIKDGELTHATLHDSKGGLLDHVYHGADRLNTLLHDKDKNINLHKDFSLDVEYRGEQSLFNRKDCGRFTAYYAHKITEHGSLDNTSRAEARTFFTHHFG